MRRATVSLAVLLLVPVVALLLAPRAALLIFAGALLAVAIRGPASALVRRTGLPGWAAVVLVVLGVAGALGLAAWTAAPVLAAQFEELVRQMPAAWAGLQDWLGDRAWGRALLEEVAPGDLVSQVAPGAAGVATAAVAGTAVRLTDAVFLLFLGAFFAATPRAYLEGIAALLTPELRSRCRLVQVELGRVLTAWVSAQAVAMAIVGGLTYAGLTAIGMNLAGILAVLAALLGFIPILGPIIAAVPALLLAFADGWSTVLLVAGLYVAIQILEGDVVTPLLQSRAIHLPPGVILLAQLVMVSMYGLLGLALAAPLAAVLLVLVRRLYVEGYVEAREPPAR
jgi:predicted PurR-regulated permease PerM